MPAVTRTALMDTVISHIYLSVYFILSNDTTEAIHKYNNVWAGLTRLERALTVTHNPMEHETSRTVAQEVAKIVVKTQKNTQNKNENLMFCRMVGWVQIT